MTPSKPKFGKELRYVGRYPEDCGGFRRIRVVRFDRWYEDKPRRRRGGILERGHNAGIKPPNWQKTYPAEPLTPAEVVALMDCCDERTKAGIRNRALIAFLWRTGLRISEALDLRPHHVDFQARTVVVLKGKNSKRRTVGIDDGALLELSRWLMCRARLGVPATAPLFCSVNKPNPGRRLWGAYVRERLHELGEKAGIQKRVHPHGLRHTLACDLVREKVPVHLVQRQLGHSNLGTTDRYLSGIAPYDVVDAVSARVWPDDSAAFGAPR